MKRLLVLTLFVFSAFGQAASHSVTLKWADGINPTGTTYNVYRSIGVCQSGMVGTKVNGTPITTLGFVDPTVVQNTNYCYSVRAYLNAIESIDSNLVTAVIPADLFAPTGLSAVIK